MESFWVHLARHFADRYRSVLAYPRISTIPKAVREAPLEVVLADFTARGWRAVRDQQRFIRTRRVRVAYLTDAPVRDWRYLAWRLAGVRHVVVHDHTPGNRTVPRGFKRLAKRLLNRLPGVTADALIGATAFVTERHRASTCFPPARCFTAENGLPPREPPAPVDVHARFGIPSGRLIVVTVGRADRIKGIAVAIEALARLVGEGRQDVQLLHIGDGPDLDLFRRRAIELGVQAQVTFGGRQEDVPAMLRGCDIAVHPSFAEVGYSLAILEYMEAGLPVIVSDDPSVSGATEHGVTGLLFQTGQAESLACSLRTLLADPALRARIGQAGRDRLIHRFSLRNTHRALASAMNAIVGRTEGLGS